MFISRARMRCMGRQRAQTRIVARLPDLVVSRRASDLHRNSTIANMRSAKLSQTRYLVVNVLMRQPLHSWRVSSSVGIRETRSPSELSWTSSMNAARKCARLSNKVKRSASHQLALVERSTWE
jgi:hypothetical protein